ncbi:hypothetical protein BH10ACT11_BH10ACT11_19800 [soil metagenome]
MAQTRTFAGTSKNVVAAALLALALLAAAAALLSGPETSVARGSSTCPTFRVLGNDRIGPAILPKGTYSVTVSRGFSCADASSHFTRFLQDYDGKLPSGWAVAALGRGKAAFTRHGKRYFLVSKQGSGGGGGGGHHHSPQLGTRCPGLFQVQHNDRIGPLKFPKGGYQLFIPRGSKVTCANASKLFTKFLARPDGSLPAGYRITGETAIFYKKDNPVHRRFRVDPGT